MGEILNYDDFINSKRETVKPFGFSLPSSAINPMLFDYQRDIVRWALRLGRAAIFAECGLGKTPMQLEWAQQVAHHTGGSVLILTPLAVAHQTIREAGKFGVNAVYCRSQEEAEASGSAIIVANYEILDKFDADAFAGVVLDESSILKAFTGKTKRQLLASFAETPYRLACTATPAPNDHLELGNHADFLGIMPSNEMISRWFINDSMAAGSYRLKEHAAQSFWRWVTSWAVCIEVPSDLGDGYSDEGFILPPLEIVEHIVKVDNRRAFNDGRLFVDATVSATQMWAEKRETQIDRVRAAVDLLATDTQSPWIVWCDTNSEADILKGCLPEAVEVRGSDSVDAKRRKLEAFTDGEARIIITKPDIAGFGLNWQHCTNQVFVGVTYSFEKFYQALRRSYRFGVKSPVYAHVIIAESEGNVAEVLKRKREDHQILQKEMSAAMRQNGFSTEGEREELRDVEEDIAVGEDWTLYLGDCVTSMRHIPDDSIHLGVFSPPFANLYIYSDSIADMGNCADYQEFRQHHDYLSAELFRVIAPGRIVAIHCKDLPLYMNRDGAAGLYDFPSLLRESMESAGFVYHSRVTIWKDPVIEMQRTKNHGLLHRNFTERAEVVRQGMADYMLMFRKWVPAMPDKQVTHHLIAPPVGEEDKPGHHIFIGENPPEHYDSDRDYSIQVWQRYASPVWFDISQTNVLNGRIARDDKDEKHICPLQLDVIERCIDLWSNPGEVVFSPFAGIGSEGYSALKMRRKFVGVELKRSYWEMAQKYLEEAASERLQIGLFDFAELEMAAD